MSRPRYLIVNADDLGRSPGINRGIVRAHREGIVTSASLMVRWPAASEAAAYARRNPDLSVGLHVDLAEWAFRGGEWVPVYQVVSDRDGGAVREEVGRQLETFRRLTGADPTHLDSHQHVHRVQPAASVLRELARGLDVPLRHFHPTVRYCGDFFGQTGEGAPIPDALSVERLGGILAALPEGVSELGCHPGDGTDADSVYDRERATEVEVLCDPRVRALLESERIVLRSFRGIGHAAAAHTAS